MQSFLKLEYWNVLYLNGSALEIKEYSLSYCIIVLTIAHKHNKESNKTQNKIFREKNIKDRATEISWCMYEIYLTIWNKVFYILMTRVHVSERLEHEWSIDKILP